MSKALSVDLRDRVVAAVAPSGGGAVRGQRFERDPLDGPGACDRRCAAPAGGRGQAVSPDRGLRAVILSAVEAKSDITLAELRALLAEHGVGVAISTLCRIFARRKITLKKVPTCVGAGPSRRPDATQSLVRGPARPRSGAARLHRRDGGQHQDGAAARARAAGSAPPLQRAPWTLENDYLYRRPASRRHDGAHGLDGPMTGAWSLACYPRRLAARRSAWSGRSAR